MLGEGPPAASVRKRSIDSDSANASLPEIEVVRRPFGAATSPTRTTWAPLACGEPRGSSSSSASSVAMGTSSLEPSSTGARSGAAINAEAAIPVRQSSSFTSDTSLGRVALERPGYTARATAAASATAS
jgi:hypothetical protein